MIDPNAKVPGFFLVLFPDSGLNHVRAVLTGPFITGQLGLSDDGRSTAELAEVYGFTGSLLNQFLEAHLIQRWAGKTWLSKNDYRILRKEMPIRTFSGILPDSFSSMECFWKWG